MPFPLILFNSSYSLFDRVGFCVELKLLFEVEVLKLARSAIKLGERTEADTRPEFEAGLLAAMGFDGSLTVVFNEYNEELKV